VHLLATRPGGYAAGDGIVDLAQTPADLVLLSSADTELSSLAHACEALPPDFPTLRLAQMMQLRSHASVDLYVDRVLEQARLVIVSLTGGIEYWSYGIERLVELTQTRGLQLVVVPGDDAPDPTLAALCTSDTDSCHRIWRYLREGGPDNARALLTFVAQRFFARALDSAPPRVLPRVALYRPRGGKLDVRRQLSSRGIQRPVAALIFYRAHLQAGNLAAFDALIEQLRLVGLDPLPLAVASLKEPSCRARVDAWLRRTQAAVVLNTTGFAIGSFTSQDISPPLGAGVPILQVIPSGSNTDDWRNGSAGLAPHDLAMHVVLPEVDGRIVTRAFSFKERARRCERAQLDVVEYRAEPERTAFVARLAASWVRLARTPPAERRIALILANYPTRNGRLGNGVGLDTPASTLEILRALAAAGYRVEDIPQDGTVLMERLQAQITNDVDLIAARPHHQALSLDDYARVLAALPAELTAQIHDRWGPPEHDPFLRRGALMVSGLQLGSVFVGIQPARGYHLDESATYHDPDLVPPHGYLAFYGWLRHAFDAHAIVHVGKHGNLEWLPGKSVGLSASCWPDAVLGPLPHLYPFIVNDPGEGTQAKRRAQAVIIDHLMPPLTRAETYGELRNLEVLVDEYYQALTLDPRRVALLREAIWSGARAAHLDRELAFPERSPDSDDTRWMVSLDAYLCEIKEAQIRDGLHVFGHAPSGSARTDTLVALARLPAAAATASEPSDSLLVALSCALLGAAFDPLAPDWSVPWTGTRPDVLAKLTDDPWRSMGDTRERLELLMRAIVEDRFQAPIECAAAVRRVKQRLAPALDACSEAEIAGLLQGLAGRFVPPGPSGAPTRGRPDVLPTGRNFYSVDVRAVPTRAAWQLATRAAERLIERHLQDHGEYPRCIGVSVWGTATMRTGGDDIAQALALLGVRPVWDPESARVVDSEVLPASVLRRPRVDVVLRISGFFRDAFPELIVLVDAAVRAVSELDEPEDVNPLRARVLRDSERMRAEGATAEAAAARARWRIFGSKPGAYGAGLQGLIDQRCWRDRSDLAAAYLNWSGYAYSRESRGSDAHGVLQTRLASLDAVLQNQDNREHDLLDSDDYYQFQGGMSVAAESARGAPVAIYHGDHSNPAAPRIRTLREELSRVIRSRAVNPKWIAGAQRHGYKGAAEMAATLDYVFAYDAATGVVEDHQYALLAQAYVLDPVSRAFLSAHNPSALYEMTERLLEAIQRGMWREPGALHAALQDLLLDAEETGA